MSCCCWGTQHGLQWADCADIASPSDWMCSQWGACGVRGAGVTVCKEGLTHLQDFIPLWDYCEWVEVDADVWSNQSLWVFLSQSATLFPGYIVGGQAAKKRPLILLVLWRVSCANTLHLSPWPRGKLNISELWPCNSTRPECNNTECFMTSLLRHHKIRLVPTLLRPHYKSTCNKPAHTHAHMHTHTRIHNREESQDSLESEIEVDECLVSKLNKTSH